MPAEPLPSIDISSIRAREDSILARPRVLRVGGLSSLSLYVEDSVGENGGKTRCANPRTLEELRAGLAGCT
jgi:hypothetical protein